LDDGMSSLADLHGGHRSKSLVRHHFADLHVNLSGSKRPMGFEFIKAIHGYNDDRSFSFERDLEDPGPEFTQLWAFAPGSFRTNPQRLTALDFFDGHKHHFQSFAIVFAVQRQKAGMTQPGPNNRDVQKTVLHDIGESMTTDPADYRDRVPIGLMISDQQELMVLWDQVLVFKNDLHSRESQKKPGRPFDHRAEETGRIKLDLLRIEEQTDDAQNQIKSHERCHPHQRINDRQAPPDDPGGWDLFKNDVQSGADGRHHRENEDDHGFILS